MLFKNEFIHINPSFLIDFFTFRPNQIINLILPLFVVLSKDDNLIVRQTCLESVLDLTNYLNDSKSIESATQMIVSLIKFGLSSRTLTFITTIALRLSDICNVFHGKKYIEIHILFL